MIEQAVYLDYAATTPVSEQAFAAAEPYFKTIFFNPASTHSLGQSAAKATERARNKCARSVGADSDEIIFTSGGTEAVNLAFGCIRHTGKNRIIVSAIEHDSALACAENAKNSGFAVDYVYPDENGIIRPESLEKIITEKTAFVCVMTVNNIIGSVQPIKELCDIAHKNGALFFTDAVQAVNSVEINVKNTGVDMLAVSAHKFYSLKGAGFLYVKRGVKLAPSIVGGEQERGLRAGTHDVPAITAMGEAIELAVKSRNEYTSHTARLCEMFLNELEFGSPVTCMNKTPDIVSVVFDGVNGGRLAVALSVAGVCCSVGSACSAGSATPPKTLTAMGVKNADCSVRFSFGRTTTEQQVLRAAKTVNTTVKRMRCALT